MTSNPTSAIMGKKYMIASANWGKTYLWQVPTGAERYMYHAVTTVLKQQRLCLPNGLSPTVVAVLKVSECCLLRACRQCKDLRPPWYTTYSSQLWSTGSCQLQLQPQLPQPSLSMVPVVSLLIHFLKTMMRRIGSWGSFWPQFYTECLTAIQKVWWSR